MLLIRKIIKQGNSKIVTIPKEALDLQKGHTELMFYVYDNKDRERLEHQRR